MNAMVLVVVMVVVVVTQEGHYHVKLHTPLHAVHDRTRTFLPRRRRQQVPKKCWFRCTTPHGVKSLTTVILIVAGSMDCTNLPDVYEHGRARDAQWILLWWMAWITARRVKTLRAGVAVIDWNVHLPTLTVRYWNPRADVRKSRVVISTPTRSNMCFMTVFISPSKQLLTYDWYFCAAVTKTFKKCVH